jgi:primosomal protein N' (replication factor Y)
MASTQVDTNQLIHPETFDAIKEVIHQNKKILLIHEKKGDFQRLSCPNCGPYISCPECENALKFSKNALICDSGHEFKDIDHCPQCHSYLIKTEYGIHKLLEELQEFNVNTITSDSKKPQEILNDFVEDGVILISSSTLLNLEFLPDIAIIVFILWDDLIKDPYYGRIDGFTAINKASEFLSNSASLIIQTYQEDHPALLSFTANKTQFFQEELERFKQLNLPPFQEMVQIILEEAPLDKRKFYGASAIKYLEKALRGHAKIYGPNHLNVRTVITIKADDLSPYRASFRSLIQAFYDEIKIELRTHQFI